MATKILKKYLLYILFVVPIMIGVFSVPQIEFDSSPDAVLAENGIEQKGKVEQKSDYDFYTTIYLSSKSSIFSKDYFNQLDSLSDYLKIKNKGGEVVGLNSVKLDSITLVENWEDSIGIFNYLDIYPKFIGSDRKSTALYVMHNAPLNLDLRNFNSNGFDCLLFNDAQQGEIDLWLSRDLLKILMISVLGILIFLVFYLKSLLNVIVSILYITATLSFVLGAIVFLQLKLNTVTIIIPVITIIICISDLMHFYTVGQSYPNLSGRAIVLKIKKPLFLTSITTFLGFISLCFSELYVLRVLGAIVCFSILVSFVLIIFLVPIFYDSNSKHELSGYLRKTSKGWLGFVVVLVVLIGGVGRVKVDQFLFDDYDTDIAYAQCLNFQENSFEGVRKFHCQISDIEMSSPVEAVQKLSKIENELIDSFKIKTYDSYVNSLKRLNRKLNLNKPEYYCLPKDVESLKSLMNLWPIDSSLLVSSNGSTFDIVGMVHDLGSSRFNEIKSKLNLNVSFVAKEDYLDEANLRITNSLGIGVLFVILLTGVILLLVFKSIYITIISLLVNFIPLACVLGFMGWFGMDLNIITASVFTILFGIAVDDTIHFLMFYKSEDYRDNRITGSGKAIIRTSIILIVGFSGLLFSGLNSVNSIGMLMIVGVLIALLSDLIILPKLISLKLKKKPFSE